MKGFFILLALIFSVSNAHAAELKHGRYIGWIHLDDRNERLAVVADFFLESPEDFTQFPRLNASFRIGLGGYNTHEYFTETFHDLKYDFDNGALTFDEPGNDLIMATEIGTLGGRTKVTGSVFVRSSAVSGRLELLQESDEPGEGFHTTTLSSQAPFASLLEGQYEGLCNDKPSAFQIQTVRGLDNHGNDSTGLERHYGIVGRHLYKNDSFCGNLAEGLWCTRQHFENGSFNFYTGQLTLESKQGGEECRLLGSELSCKLRVRSETVACRFEKRSNPQSARFYNRSFHLNPTREQNQALPNPEPPKNKDLSDALKGRFWGYLHNEANNTYLPLRLDVIPYSSTENPHNPNQMLVSAISSLFLGGDFNGPFFTQRFEPRSFYLRPGFMLAATNVDSMFSISSWKKGFISGVWMSKAFGRVGTFQLVKGDAPPLPASAKAVRSFAGEFQRYLDSTQQWMRFLLPTQPSSLKDQIIPFNGSYQAAVGITPVQRIEAGAFDPFTGRLGWRISYDEAITFGSGLLNDKGEALLFWPPYPIVGTIARSFEFQPFQRKEEK